MNSSNPSHAYPHLIPTPVKGPLPGPDANLLAYQFPLREAVLSGDYARQDKLGTYLLVKGGVAFGTDHPRLILLTAVGRLGTTVTSPVELPAYWRPFGPTITMLQIEVEHHRGPGALAQSRMPTLTQLTGSPTT